MKTEFILSLLESNQTELLKKLLKEELYKNSLSVGAKSRYNAMKRFHKHIAKDVAKGDALRKPYKLEEGYFFIDGYTAVLTTEDVGDMELCPPYAQLTDPLQFFKVKGDKKSLDLNDVLVRAKSTGYKYSPKQVASRDYTHVLKLGEKTINVALLDQSYSVINDGKPATVINVEGKNTPLYIETSIGKAIVLPVRIDLATTDKKVIEVQI